MWAADTNVLVRLITRDDPDQTKTAEKFLAQGVWVSSLVLAETVWVLANVYDLNPAGQAQAVETILEHGQIVVEDSSVAVAALNRFRNHPNVGFYDFMILETARKAGNLPLGTFGRRLSKEPGAHRLGA